MSHFDVLVIGGGPAGERAAIQAARAERRAAIVERAHVIGGTCINWGTIPSKTLRESALFVHALTRGKLHGIQVALPQGITVADFMHRKQQVVQREIELVNATLDRYQIEVFQGQARFDDAHTIALLDEGEQSRTRLSGEVIVIATGSRPARPLEVPFDAEHIFDSDTILDLPVMPRSMIVLGAGVIGIEYAAIFAALGVQVTLVDTRDRLLPYFDREIAEILKRELKRLGLIILHEERHRTIELQGAATGKRMVRCLTEAGNCLEADVLLYCVGRDGNTRDLGLETIGLQADERGLLRVNEHFQTELPHLYAVGDVIGYPALASTSMEQGRQAIRHALGLPGQPRRSEMLPFAIYAIPEASYIGETEEELQARGADYVAGRGRYEMNPRGQIIGELGGMLKLLFEGEELRLVGAHLVGRDASELVHIAQAWLHAGGTAQQIAETLFNYPTLADLYRHAALEALKAWRLRGGAGGAGGNR